MCPATVVLLGAGGTLAITVLLANGVTPLALLLAVPLGIAVGLVRRPRD